MMYFPRLASKYQGKQRDTLKGVGAWAITTLIALSISWGVEATTVYYAKPGDNLAQKAAMLMPGDTLILNDGIYQDTPLRVENRQGTAAAPITIKAAHDGKAIIDIGGMKTQQYNPAVFIGNGTAYIRLEGIVARNSPLASVVEVYGTAHDIAIRRVTAYNAGVGNHHVFDVSFGANNILIENCAGWGRGRYIFIAYEASNVTFRRDFGYWEDTEEFSPAPRGAFSVYNSSNILLENNIGTHAIPFKTDDNYYTGVWETSSDPVKWPTNNTTYLGNIFYNNCEGFNVQENVGYNSQFKDNYFEAPYSETCKRYIPTRYRPQAFRYDGPQYGSITNSVFANSYEGLRKTTAAPVPIANSVFINNKTAVINESGHSYINLYRNENNGTNVSVTDRQIDPDYDTARYGRGAYLFIPNGSPLKGAGEHRTDMGAHIIYEYVDGVLTTTPLWPWPMEDRIMAEKGVSVTYEAQGGIWKTLQGVYPKPEK